MNEKIVMWVVAAFLLLAIVCWVNDARAEMQAEDDSHIEKSAATLCSKKSVAISKKWMRNQAQIEQDLKNSPIASPETRMMAIANALAATRGYEALVLNCAIWKRLGLGV